MQRPAAYSPAVRMNARPSPRVRSRVEKPRPATRTRRLDPSGVVLRPFQRSDVHRLYKALTPPETDLIARVLYQLASGAGKTVVACAVAKKWLSGTPGSAVLWVTHREELRRQAAERMRRMKVDAFDMVEMSPSKRSLRPGSVAIVSPAAEMEFDSGPGDLLIVDEAHHSLAPTWLKMISEWNGPVLGLTATPCRLASGQGLGRVYDALIQGPRVSQLVEEGHLAPVVVKDVNPPLVTGKGRSGQDYNMTATAAASRDVFSSAEPVDLWKNSCADPAGRTVWYVPAVDSGRRLTTSLCNAGLSAKMVAAATPSAERKETMSGFSDGRVQHLVNVDIVTEGFDCPDVSTVMILRPTKSVPVYLQMVGRTARVSANGSRVAVVVDAARCWKELGHPADDRVWSLDDGSPDTVRVLSAVACPSCDCLLASGTAVCHLCGKGLGKMCPACGCVRPPGDWYLEDSACDMCVSGTTAPGKWERSHRGQWMDLGRRGRFEALPARGRRPARLRWVPRGLSPGDPGSVVFKFPSEQDACAGAESLCRGESLEIGARRYSLVSTGLLPTISTPSEGAGAVAVSSASD